MRHEPSLSTLSHLFLTAFDFPQRKDDRTQRMPIVRLATRRSLEAPDIKYFQGTIASTDHVIAHCWWLRQTARDSVIGVGAWVFQKVWPQSRRLRQSEMIAASRPQYMEPFLAVMNLHPILPQSELSSSVLKSSGCFALRRVLTRYFAGADSRSPPWRSCSAVHKQ